MDNDILDFVKTCVSQRRIYWTYHVNMRMRGRSISRPEIISAVDSFEIIEKYPDDKYLPSYLVYAKCGEQVYHVHIAVDVEGDSVRIVTAYRPHPNEWDADLKKRRKP